MSDEQSELEAPSSQVTVEAPVKDGFVVPEKFQAETDRESLMKACKGYQEVESMMGSRYPLPTEDSSKEKWDEFSDKVTGTGKFISRPDPENEEQMNTLYNQLGRPETPEGYNVEIPEEIKPMIDPDLYNSYAELAHKEGFNNKQAQAMFNFELARMEKQAEAANAMKQGAEQQLRDMWGPDYDNRMAGAKAAAIAYQEKFPEAVKELVSGPAANNPALIAMLSELGHTLHESGHAGAVGAPKYGMSSEEARSKIIEISSNKDHPYNDTHSSARADIAAHDEAVKRMEELYRIANSRE